MADSLSADHPSLAYRNHAVEILSRVELLGPIGGPNATPRDEFRRVYRFLHYNDPTQVKATIHQLLQSFGRPKTGSDTFPATKNAWNYVVGAFDRSVCRARIFYLAVGLIEATLRSRLDARFTDEFGPDWAGSEHVPSSVSEYVNQLPAKARLNEIRRAVEANEAGAMPAVVLAQVTAILATAAPPPTKGSEYVNDLEFGQLRSFFQTKRLWKKAPKLGSIFHDPTTKASPLYEDVNKALGVIHDARNDMAHYRPPSSARFSHVLYETAKLSRWLGVELQHFYGSVDTRLSTELSHLVDEPSLKQRALGKSPGCEGTTRGAACMIPAPIDVLLTAAPIAAEEVDTITTTAACLFHRVQLRTAFHRPTGE